MPETKEQNMSTNVTGIILGGLMPAIVFGLSGLFLKTSGKSGISLNYYLLFCGVGVMAAAALSFLIFKDHILNFKGAVSSFLVGFLWAVGATLMVAAVAYAKIQISVLAPIVAANSLVTVLLGFAVYSEWQTVDLLKLLAGAVLVIAGGILVAQSA
jgi:transporter family protein